MNLPDPAHVKLMQMKSSAAPNGTCLHLLELAQTTSGHLSLTRILSDSSAASRKHVNNKKKKRKRNRKRKKNKIKNKRNSIAHDLPFATHYSH